MVLIWLIKGVFYYIYKKNVIKISEYNSIEYADLTYYQRNRDVILNRAKDYYENDKEKLREQARKNKKKKIKKENIEKIDISICLKKRKKD